MNIDDLLLQVESYIRLRRALGHVIASEEKELKNFIYFFSEQGGSGTIRAQIIRLSALISMKLSEFIRGELTVGDQPSSLASPECSSQSGRR